MNSCNFRFKDVSRVLRTVRMARRNSDTIRYADEHTMRFRTMEEKEKRYKENSYNMISRYIYSGYSGYGFFY